MLHSIFLKSRNLFSGVCIHCLVRAGSFCCLLAIVLAISLLPDVASGQPVTDLRAEKDALPIRILILNSYHYGNSHSDQELEGIKSVLPSGSEYFVEYMDAKRISGQPDYMAKLYDIYKYKYKQKSFDIILSMDDDAFQFLLRYHNDLFPNTPVVFCGLNKFEPSMVADEPLFTGVVEAIDVRGTIELALKLHPDTRAIYFINDNTTSGKIDRAIAEGIEKSGEFAVKFEYLNTAEGITFDELLAKLKTLPPDSLIDYLNFYQDSTGEIFDPAIVLTEIARVAPAPLYTQIGIFLGYGAVGGKLNSGFYLGETAGKMALRILNGEPVSQIPILTQGVTRYMFDYRQLKRWGIPLSALPADSVLINREISFFERYRRYIIAGIGFVFLQTLVIALLGLNIHRRRIAEKNLLAKTEELDRYFLSSLDLLCIADTDGFFRRLNPEWEKTLGYPLDELEGQRFLDFVHPEDVAATLASIDQLNTSNSVLNFVNRYRCKDGTYRWIEWRSFRFDKMIYAVARDISERKWVEEALRASESNFKGIFENAVEGIYRTTMDGRVISANPAMARILAYDTTEELIKDLGDVRQKLYVRPEDRDVFLAAIRQSGIVQGYELQFYRKDRQVIWAELNSRLRQDEQSGELFIDGFVNDITERKQAEAEVYRLNAELEKRVMDRTARLEAANKELEAFSYSVSHDLRAPLRAIDGFTKILLEDYGKTLDDEGKQVCGIIRDNTKRMSQLIDELLAFSRLGRSEVKYTSIDMTTLVRSVFQELTPPDDRAHIELRLDPLLDAVGDHAMIRQVWMNLLSNAVKFSSKRERSVIQVGCIEENCEIVYFVRDNGIGFDMQYKEKLFGVFERLHSGREFDGVGVGLAIVQRVILRHGGRVWAEGEVDKGATFFFSLPLKSD